MKRQDLEQQFKATLSEAQSDLESFDLRLLWDALEQELVTLPNLDQLRLAGVIVAELAEIYQAKAAQIFDDWEEGYNTEGPIPTDGLLEGIRVRQSQHVDVSTLVRSRRRHTEKKPTYQPDSVAQPTDKAEILAMADEIEAARPLSVAHVEDVSAWVKAITTYLRQQSSTAISFAQLQQALNLSLIEIWLGLLLGGYQLEQRGAFYTQHNIWIRNQYHCSGD